MLYRPSGPAADCMDYSNGTITYSTSCPSLHGRSRNKPGTAIVWRCSLEHRLFQELRHFTTIEWFISKLVRWSSAINLSSFEISIVVKYNLWNQKLGAIVCNQKLDANFWLQTLYRTYRTTIETLWNKNLTTRAGLVFLICFLRWRYFQILCCSFRFLT